MTRGIVSGVRRFKADKLVLIQADVDIQPGNSGGPLVDCSGNLLGISVSNLREASSGVNFFIPIHDALAKLKLERTETVSTSR